MIRAEWPLITSEDPVDAMEDLSVKLRLLKRKVKDWTRVKSLEMRDKSILIEDEIKILLVFFVIGIILGFWLLGSSYRGGWTMNYNLLGCKAD